MSSTFAFLIQQFFGSLRNQRNLSPHTISAYRDAFRLLLRFLAEQQRKTIDQLTLEMLSADAVLLFLEQLEKARGNTIRTRNARLAAIHAFARFAIAQKAPDFVVAGQRILAIPCKRTGKPVLGFMNREEVKAILAATDSNIRAGRRDRLLVTLLYNTRGPLSPRVPVTPAGRSTPSTHPPFRPFAREGAPACCPRCPPTPAVASPRCSGSSRRKLTTAVFGCMARAAKSVTFRSGPTPSERFAIGVAPTTSVPSSPFSATVTVFLSAGRARRCD